MAALLDPHRSPCGKQPCGLGADSVLCQSRDAARPSRRTRSYCAEPLNWHGVTENADESITASPLTDLDDTLITHLWRAPDLQIQKTRSCVRAVFCDDSQTSRSFITFMVFVVASKLIVVEHRLP